MYKVFAEAPDPYPLLEAAVVCPYCCLHGDVVPNEPGQDQTVKVAEARELELELWRVKEENADFKKRLNETSSLESAKKKAEARAEQLEQRVRHVSYVGAVN